MTNITVLKSLGPKLCKTWLPDGTIGDYENAARYTVELVSIDSIVGLHALIERIAPTPTVCIIRGTPISPIARGEKVVRQLEVFEDKPSHYFMVDVDKFDGTIEEFVATLPACFQDVSYVWQYSGSHGHPTKPGLRAHLFFWLEEPMTCADAEAWTTEYLPNADHVVHRTVQANYTAAPLTNGASDLVPVRLGFTQGMLDDVVRIPLDMPVPVASTTRLPRADRMGLKDPRTKAGIIGAVCRAFTPAAVVAMFPEHFVVSSGRDKARFTCLKGTSKESGRIGDAGTGMFDNSDHAPGGSRLMNVFDFIRNQVFGHLDANVDPDALALEPNAAPSYRAMVDWARARPEVQAELVTPAAEKATEVLIEAKVVEAEAELPDRLARLQRMKLSVLVCPDVLTLEQTTAPRLAAADLSDGERYELVVAIQARTRELLGGRGLPTTTVRRWLTPVVTGTRAFPDMDSEGKQPLMTDANIKVVLARMGVQPRYNLIAKKIDFVHPGEVNFSIENASNNTRTMIVSEAARLGMRPSKDLINNYIDLIAAENSYNPALDWIDSAPWDGRSRVSELAATITAREGFPDERKVLMLRKWLIQGAALAATEHPITARGVLIVQGAQYVGKSRRLKSLVPGNESLAALGVTIDATQRDSKKSATRAWLVELGELDATFRKSDIAALKAFVAQDVDERRDAYERDHAEFMRRTSFYGSVNDEHFLHDQTGNTRFWVIPVAAMDHTHGVDMQQVWAEALALWRGGEPHWLTNAEMGQVEESSEHFSVRSMIEEKVIAAFDWDAGLANEPGVEWVWLTTLQVLNRMGEQYPTDGDCKSVGRAVRKLSGRPSKSTGRSRLICVPVGPIAEGLKGFGSRDSVAETTFG